MIVSRAKLESKTSYIRACYTPSVRAGRGLVTLCGYSDAPFEQKGQFHGQA